MCTCYSESNSRVGVCFFEFWVGEGSDWFIQPKVGKAVRKGPSKVGSLCGRNIVVDQ